MNSPLQWQCSRSARMSSLPPDYDKQTLSLALLKDLEMCGALCPLFQNASLCPPLFVHMALQF